MNNKLPAGAITDIKNITPGMMVKVKEDPVLHRCNYREYSVIQLEHAPRMEYYDDSILGYENSPSYDFVHVNSIEYAIPPIPLGTIAVARRDGGITLVEVDAKCVG